MVIEAKLGVIGGSGHYDLEGLVNIREADVQTPFGAPSDTITLGTLNNAPIAFLPRHGKGHRLGPGEVPTKANVYALKSLGVERIISMSAVGSLQEKIQPLDVVIPDQIIDRTKNRPSTFFGAGIVAHIAFGDPYCSELRQIVIEASGRHQPRTHMKGTLIVIEGPAFSTLAESNLYRSWEGDIVGMTALPEAKLAREAEICYSTLAFVTDYDCWHENAESVTAELVIKNLKRNAATGRRILNDVIALLPDSRNCSCECALENSIVTTPDKIPSDTKTELALIIGKYFNTKSEVS